MLDRFFPPQTAGLDQETAASALKCITWALMGASLLLLVAMREMPDYTWRWLATIASVYLIGTPVLILVRAGRPKTAGVVLAAGTGLVTTVLALTAGGISAIAPLMYLLPVVVMGLLFGGRAGTITAAICLLTSVVLAILES